MHWHPTEVKRLSASLCEDPGVHAFPLHCFNPRKMSSRESRGNVSARTSLPKPELTDLVPEASPLLCARELLLNRQFQRKANIDLSKKANAILLLGA